MSKDKLYSILDKLNLLDKEIYSSEDLQQVAIRGVVKHILTGSYAKSGDKWRINFTIQEAGTGKRVGGGSTEGNENEIFSMVDKLSIQVKPFLELSDAEIADDYDRKIGEVTTSSPEAYRYYVQAQRARMFLEIEKSTELLEKAVELDPEFAMAYRMLWFNYRELGNADKSQEAKQKMMGLMDKISEREKLHIQYNLAGGTNKRIEIAEKILKLYPEDPTTLNDQGIFYCWREEWDKAIDRFEKLVQLKDDNPHLYVNLATAYRAMGLYSKSDTIQQTYLREFYDHFFVHMGLARSYMCQGKYDFALSEIDKALSINPDDNYSKLTKYEIYLLKGDFVQAEKESRKMLQSDSPAGRDILIRLFMLQGKFEKAKIEADEIIKLGESSGNKSWINSGISWKAWADIQKGNIQEGLEEFNEVEGLNPVDNIYFLIKANMIEEAQKVWEELNAYGAKDPDYKQLRRNTLTSQAWIEIEKGNYSDAVENLKEAIYLLPYQHGAMRPRDDLVWIIGSLAQAYYEKGDFEEAKQEYERITGLTTGRILDDRAVYPRSFYMLGKIHEKLGDKAKAIVNYERFLELWKDADPGLPEVEDAKARLATL